MSFIDILIKLDKDFFLFLNGFHSQTLDHIMIIISAKLTWIPLYAGIAFYIFKRYRLNKGILVFIFFILLIVLTDQTSVHLFKNVFQRLRPCFDFEIKGLVHYINMPGGKYGFVSSHATNSFGFAFLSLFLFKHKTYTILILFWACLVSYSRIYLGVHFPGDILGGALLGFFISMLILIIIKKILRNKPKSTFP